MRLNANVDEMTPFGPFAAAVYGEMTFDSDDTIEGLSRRQGDRPARYKCVLHRET